MRNCTFFLLTFATSLSAYFGTPRLDILCGPDRFGIGPEVYYIDRIQDVIEDLPEIGEKERPSTISQEGWMYGERISYDRLRCNSLYYGADQYYAIGCVDACTKRGKNPKRQLKDAEVEGRIGYTFGICSPLRAFFTPIVGFGNFNGQDKFKRPFTFHLIGHKKNKKFERTKITLRPRFNFVSTGFLSGLFLNDCSSIGINFKAKFMTSGKNKIVRRREIRDKCDCENGKKKKRKQTICQEMGKRTQYQLDIPLTYYGYCVREEAFEMNLIPFYRYRHYGEAKNFPIDFPDTKFHMVGARFLLTYVF